MQFLYIFFLLLIIINTHSWKIYTINPFISLSLCIWINSFKYLMIPCHFYYSIFVFYFYFFFFISFRIKPKFKIFEWKEKNKRKRSEIPYLIKFRCSFVCLYGVHGLCNFFPSSTKNENVIFILNVKLSKKKQNNT